MLSGYDATLDSPISQPNITDRMLNKIEWNFDYDPGAWKALNAGQKLNGTKITFWYNDWYNDGSKWHLVPNAGASFQITAAEYFTGDLSGTALNTRNQIKALAIAAGVLSADDTFE